MLEELDKAKSDLVVEKTRIENEQQATKKQLQALETEIITLQINQKRAEEILGEEAKLVSRARLTHVVD